MSSNQIGGFFNRLEASRKYLFGSVGVLGQSNNSIISGVLIGRGQDIKPVVDVAPDYESYEYKKLDLDNAEEKAFFEAALAWDLEIDGKKWVDGKNVSATASRCALRTLTFPRSSSKRSGDDVLMKAVSIASLCLDLIGIVSVQCSMQKSKRTGTCIFDVGVAFEDVHYEVSSLRVHDADAVNSVREPPHDGAHASRDKQRAIEECAEDLVLGQRREEVHDSDVCFCVWS